MIDITKTPEVTGDEIIDFYVSFIDFNNDYGYKDKRLGNQRCLILAIDKVESMIRVCSKSIYSVDCFDETQTPYEEENQMYEYLHKILAYLKSKIESK